MLKVTTDIALIEEFLTRGVEAVYPSKEALRQKLLSGDRIRVYQGFDPTGPYLHVGHAVGIKALRILQKLGHEVIFLVGDYTAKVGDPDKAAARKILTDEEIEQNKKGWKEQASQLIDFEGDNPVLFKHNYEWLSKLNMEEIIRLMSHATVQQMLERDLFQKRLKANTPIGLQEFIYPLMQGYDSVAMNVDLEIGGADQTFNMLTGRQLVKIYNNKEKYVRSNIMMEAPGGGTMSKTKGNGINLSDTPENMYGKAMSYPDNMIIKGLSLLTGVPVKEIAQISEQIETGRNPMEFKKFMAFEIVKDIKGAKAAEIAEKHFRDTVQNKSIGDADMENTSLSGNMPVSGFLKQVIKTQSLSQIRRIIEQGGVEIDGEKVTDPDRLIVFTRGMVVKYGKRKYFKVI